MLFLCIKPGFSSGMPGIKISTMEKMLKNELKFGISVKWLLISGDLLKITFVF